MESLRQLAAGSSIYDKGDIGRHGRIFKNYKGEGSHTLGEEDHFEQKEMGNTKKANGIGAGLTMHTMGTQTSDLNNPVTVEQQINENNRNMEAATSSSSLLKPTLAEQKRKRNILAKSSKMKQEKKNQINDSLFKPTPADQGRKGINRFLEENREEPQALKDQSLEAIPVGQNCRNNISGLSDVKPGKAQPIDQKLKQNIISKAMDGKQQKETQITNVAFLEPIPTDRKRKQNTLTTLPELKKKKEIGITNRQYLEHISVKQSRKNIVPSSTEMMHATVTQATNRQYLEPILHDQQRNYVDVGSSEVMPKNFKLIPEEQKRIKNIMVGSAEMKLEGSAQNGALHQPILTEPKRKNVVAGSAALKQGKPTQTMNRQYLEPNPPERDRNNVDVGSSAVKLEKFQTMNGPLFELFPDEHKQLQNILAGSSEIKLEGNVQYDPLLQLIQAEPKPKTVVAEWSEIKKVKENQAINHQYLEAIPGKQKRIYGGVGSSDMKPEKIQTMNGPVFKPIPYEQKLERNTQPCSKEIKIEEEVENVRLFEPILTEQKRKQKDFAKSSKVKHEKETQTYGAPLKAFLPKETTKANPAIFYTEGNQNKNTQKTNRLCYKPRPPKSSHSPPIRTAEEMQRNFQIIEQKLLRENQRLRKLLRKNGIIDEAMFDRAPTYNDLCTWKGRSEAGVNTNKTSIVKYEEQNAIIAKGQDEKYRKKFNEKQISLDLELQKVHAKRVGNIPKKKKKDHLSFTDNVQKRVNLALTILDLETDVPEHVYNPYSLPSVRSCGRCGRYLICKPSRENIN